MLENAKIAIRKDYVTTVDTGQLLELICMFSPQLVGGSWQMYKL